LGLRILNRRLRGFRGRVVDGNVGRRRLILGGERLDQRIRGADVLVGRLRRVRVRVDLHRDLRRYGRRLRAGLRLCLRNLGRGFVERLVDLRRGVLLLVLIILANGFIGASLGMIIFTSAIRSIPEHLFHAARADGAGALAIVRHIVFPALRWPISYMTIHQTLSLLVSFEYILLITGGGPFFDTTVFSLYAYRRAFENGQYAYGAALSLILIVIGVIAALVLWRLMDMRRLLQTPRIEVH